MAVAHGRSLAIEALRRRGANPNQLDANGSAPIRVAANRDNGALAVLLQHFPGIDVNCQRRVSAAF
jgi:ankyrin repeat protein